MLLLVLKICFVCLFYRKCMFQAPFPVLQCLYSCLIWLQPNWNKTLGKDLKLQKHQKFWCTKPWVALHELNVMQFYKCCYFLLPFKSTLNWNMCTKETLWSLFFLNLIVSSQRPPTVSEASAASYYHGNAGVLTRSTVAGSSHAGRSSNFQILTSNSFYS